MKRVFYVSVITFLLVSLVLIPYPASAGTLGSLGDFGWGGLADTYCWVDPKERLVGILMQQYSPSLTHAGRRDFRNLAYQALI